jgi:hypothetical protein
VTDLLAVAHAEGEQVRFRAHLHSSAGHAVACDALAETFPPQPGGVSVPLVVGDLDAWPSTQRVGQDVWTPTPRAITGTWRAGRVHVTAPDARRDHP